MYVALRTLGGESRGELVAIGAVIIVVLVFVVVRVAEWAESVGSEELVK